MNKSELIEVLGAKLFITQTEAERFLNGFVEMIYEQLARDQKITLYGFGQFSAVPRAAHMAVNPNNTALRLMVPKRMAVKFRAGDGLKKALTIEKQALV